MTMLQQFRAWVAPRFLAFLWFNAALVAGLALLAEREQAALLIAVSLTLTLACSAAYRAWGTVLATRVVTSIAIVAYGALYLLCAEGSGVILDVHMTFFAALAIAAAWCCWRSLVAAAGFVVLHHLVLNAVYPGAVFPAASSMARVLLHGFVVAVEVAALSLLTSKLAEAFGTSERALAQAEESRAEAARLAADYQLVAERESRAHRHIVDMARAFPQTIAELRGSFDQAAREMHDTSGSLTTMSTSASELATQVEDCAASTAERAPMVHMATQELTSAIGEIANRMSETAMLTCQGRDRAAEAQALADELSGSIDRIASFVDMIRNVAQQTNLLALNATIEAARAGEAGRGFAVVANEVKSLSAQTATAAVAIERQVDEVVSISKRTVDGVRFFASALDSIDESAIEIAASVEQQHAAIEEIATAVSFISRGAENMREFSTRAAGAADRTKGSALTAGSAATSVQLAADRLNTDVERFLHKLVQEV
ncbi:hypothetical protein GCM10007036_09010 [Alsobacter metallidurans]|uniref:Methyl-accepting transducer domain-containing protein n=1 Tax=Alsobacter metallidurans TaxID=340221 RepID=A0A917I4F0_9HYPH|nr:methyl-accepting chemotaxis protein [Alsobacter metallidurans]GGH11728.1 hypothetical protein GCM10007036_09010 [Alsobacter metallidurans]